MAMRRAFAVLVILEFATAFAEVEPLRVPLGGRSRVFVPGRPALVPVSSLAAPQGTVPPGALRPRSVIPVKRPNLDEEIERRDLKRKMEQVLSNLRRISAQMEATTVGNLRQRYGLDKPDSLRGLDGASRRELDERLRHAAVQVNQAGAEIRRALPPEKGKGGGQ